VKQLSLPFAESPSFAASDFCTAPSNLLAREWLARTEHWTNGRLILWGEAGCGKTHLLHIWAESVQAEILNGAQLRFYTRPPEMPVAVDDSDIVVDPRALLHLLNGAAEAGQPVLMTARLPPSRQVPKLADLASRLRASEVVEIGLPEDELLAMLLTRLAAERQLALSESVRRYLTTNLPRTAGAYREAVARLERAAQDGRITKILVAALVADLVSDG